MTAPSTSPPLGAPAVTAPSGTISRAQFGPDARELRSVFAVAATVVVAHVLNLGPLLFDRWLPTSLASATPQETLFVVAASFFPWLLGQVVLTFAFSRRWLPRAHERLLEPSVIASWVTLAGAAGVALLLGRAELWPWAWASTAPQTGVLITQLVTNEQYLALGLWFICACLIVPLITELLFRFAIIEYLTQRGITWLKAVAISAVLFGATYLFTVFAAPGASLQQAGIATVLGVVLGIIAVRGRRGRGLGLALIAHGTFVAFELGVLIRSLPTG
jgi:hypothetical protein